jgi:hypothetical protein
MPHRLLLRCLLAPPSSAIFDYDDKKSEAFGISNFMPFRFRTSITFSPNRFCGIGLKPANSVLHSARPSVADRISPANPNISATGVSAFNETMSPSVFMSSICPLLPWTSLVTFPSRFCGMLMKTFCTGSRKVAFARPNRLSPTSHSPIPLYVIPPRFADALMFTFSQILHTQEWIYIKIFVRPSYVQVRVAKEGKMIEQSGRQEHGTRR